MIIALPFIGKINDTLSLHSLMTVAIIVAVTLDMAINISFNPTRSIIADVTPNGSPRTKGYTWMQTISGFFGVFAYVFGAVFGNYALIWFGAILILLFSIIPTFLIKEPRELQSSTDTAAEPNLQEKKKIKWGSLLKIYLAHSFTWLGIQTMFVYIFAYISQFQFGISNVSMLNESQTSETGQIISISFAIMNTVGFLLPVFILQPLTKKFGNVKVHLLCIIIMALGYWGIVGFGNHISKLYMLMAIVGIGWASVVSLPFAIMTEMVDKSKMGLFMGIFNLSIVIPQLVVSLFLGSFVQSANDKIIIFIISAVSLSVSAFLWLFIKEQKPSMDKNLDK
jgi:maltose/moltooligosaccharide transporter